jgi:hypothetical protein
MTRAYREASTPILMITDTDAHGAHAERRADALTLPIAGASCQQRVASVYVFMASRYEDGRAMAEATAWQ